METKNEHIYSYRLILISDADEISELLLPKAAEGFYRFCYEQEIEFLNISANNGIWYATCQVPAFFQNTDLTDNYCVALLDGQLLNIECGSHHFVLSVERIYEHTSKFQKCFINTDSDIIIGSSFNSDIKCDCSCISDKHFSITRRNGLWSVTDINCMHGLFVNGLRTKNAVLKLGDVIFTIGIRIIIGIDSFSVCSGNNAITIKPYLMQKNINLDYKKYFGQDELSKTKQLFNRLPRKTNKYTPKKIVIEGPPMSMNNSQMPLLLRMGSSMVMGGSAALMGNYTMLLTSVLFPLVTSKYTDKQRHDYENLRVLKYREYLSGKLDEINSARIQESNELNKKFPHIKNWTSEFGESKRLWERCPDDDDFLNIRLGYGKLPLSSSIEYQERRFELESDALEEEMYRLAEKEYFVEDAPAILSLTENTVCGISGERTHVVDFVKDMVCQIAAFHSYDEVKIVFLTNAGDLNDLDEALYLPHTWDDNQIIHFVATNASEAFKICDYIKNQISNDASDNKKLHEILKHRPYYLIFALNKKLMESHQFISDLMDLDSNIGVSIIAAFDDLPKESQKIIYLNLRQKSVLTDLSENSLPDIQFSLDERETQSIKNVFKIISNTRLKDLSQVQELPKMITFLDMYHTGTIEQLNPLKRWQENNPVKSLAAPIGIGADGSLFNLDLHEKQQGPHGLVAGMTGSGKSEFIITYILSMAVNYHPNEVAFVLIDYKGGGLTGAFENPLTGVKLPHLVGTITNLDGASIQRSLMSIESELKRRQREFNRVKSIVNEGTMDIYTYQKLYREGKVDKPIPHLFIISDEFAELKQQQPEFMSKLISTARIGRSLGVHLILATQKPSGVVDEQIRSNTKFRVCLKVQDRSDSMDMLKRPEAAELTDTGRFYLQVGYNEYFALGQSAWCGAYYEPQDTISIKKDNEIEFLDITGQVIAKAKPSVKKVDTGEKQIVAIVKYLSDLARSQNIVVKQLWENELPKLIDSKSSLLLNEQTLLNNTSLPLGFVDDPENQIQYPYVIDFKKSRNMLIVGDKGSGKTSLIQNIIFSLINKFSPDKFNFYILDYSSRMFKTFSALPHCGAVLCEEDVGSLDEFFKIVNSLIGARKKLFSELEVDNYEAACEMCELPLILVVIDNLIGMSSSKTGENHSYLLQTYMHDSSNYGVKYIVSCNYLNEAPSRVRRELSDVICLHMKDKYDYGEALECKVSYSPPEFPGRGLVKVADNPLEIQTSLIFAEDDEKARLNNIKQRIFDICAHYGNGKTAKHMPVYSETATYEEFSYQFEPERIPIGYSKQNGRPVALPLKQFSALSIYFGNPLGVAPVLSNMVFASQRENMELWLVKRKENSVFDKEVVIPENSIIFELNEESITELRDVLMSTINSRNEQLEDYCAKNDILGDEDEKHKKTFNFIRTTMKPIMILFESVSNLSEEADNISALLIDAALKKAPYMNIYAIGCFEANDNKNVKSKLLYYGFNPKTNIMLLGGQFDKQDICIMPESDGLEKMLQYNTGIMSYRNSFYPILMPCGDLILDEPDEFEKSIF